MSIARDAGIISEAQQKEIDALFTGKDGKFDEEAFAEAFARELKRAFHETVQKRMEDVPATKAGRALRRVADFIATLAKSFAFWRQERGLDPVTGQPLQAGQVLDAFLKSARTSVDEATRLDNLARAARAASLRATAEARDNAPTQTVTDEDGTEVAYHISELFTGGPVPYWKPNLAYVGSNSGRQIDGWGHYAANTREGAVIHAPEGGAVMWQTWWTHRPEGDESHLLVDGEPLSKENAERVAQTIVHLKEEYGVTTREMDEKFWPYFDDANMTGDMAYRMVEEFFRLFTDIENPARAASRALYMHDIDGVKIPMGEETDADGTPTGKQMANYVAFSDEHLRVDRVEQWNPETWRFEQVEDPNEERRDHIRVWSGARQAYDRVDLRFIGSGTGGNNEGRGAYSSGVRGVAQDKYARGALRWWEPYIQTGKIVFNGEVFDNARKLFNSLGDALANAFFKDGGLKRTAERNYLVDGATYSEDVVLLYAVARGLGYHAFDEEDFYEFVLFRGRSDANFKDDGTHKRTLEYANRAHETALHYKNPVERNMTLFFADLVKTRLAKKKDWGAFWDSILEKAEPELIPNADPPPAVMEQTWFTNRPEGDVSHLLNWFEAVTPEQLGWIVEGARKAGLPENAIAFLQRERIDDKDVLIEDGNRMPSGREMYMRLELIGEALETYNNVMANSRSEGDVKFAESWRDRAYDDVTENALWVIHNRVLDEPGKFASEFLLTADIDGVMYPVNYRGGSRHGEEGWNYVAFSDEHLRVDHVYEYNPETDDFELKWHTAEGSGPRFTETPLGQELVARAFDAIMGSRVDLLLRPSRYYGNPYETRERNPRNALVTEHLHRDVDVSEPRGFATEVSAEISRFGTREGDPTLREIRARCGSKARFYEVLGAVYETAVGLKMGVFDVITQREFSSMEKRMPLYAWVIRHNAQARATELGRKAYIMGRQFAERLRREAVAAARAEVERQRRGRGDCGMIGGKCEGKGPSRHGERRWPKARRMR